MQLTKLVDSGARERRARSVCESVLGLGGWNGLRVNAGCNYNKKPLVESVCITIAKRTVRRVTDGVGERVGERARGSESERG